TAPSFEQESAEGGLKVFDPSDLCPLTQLALSSSDSSLSQRRCPQKMQKVRTGPSCFHFTSRFPGVTDSIGFGNASCNDSHGFSCSLARVFCVGTGVFRWACQKIRC